MVLSSKKGALNWLVVIIIIIVVLALWIVNIAGRECSDNDDCGELQYCGSDFECHDKEVVYVEKNEYLLPSVIIAVGLVVAAVIFKWRELMRR